MKPLPRILLGIVAVIGIFFGVRQMIEGFREMSGAGAKVPQKVGEIVSVTSHGCALRVPQGWEKKDSENGGVMFTAPKSSGYSANLLILSDVFAGTMKEYTEASVKTLKEVVPDAEIAAEVPFAPDTGPTGMKIGVKRKLKELELVQGVYVFEGSPGRKVAITVAAPAKQSADLEPIFETCMKSFTVLP